MSCAIMSYMVELTDKEWALYEERYGKLMHTIAMKISGDDAIASHEDNYADLCIAALESIEGFEKKTGEKFKAAINNKLFDQYTKTVLWNRKAKKGIPLTKKKWNLGIGMCLWMQVVMASMIIASRCMKELKILKLPLVHRL